MQPVLVFLETPPNIAKILFQTVPFFVQFVDHTSLDILEYTVKVRKMLIDCCLNGFDVLAFLWKGGKCLKFLQNITNQNAMNINLLLDFQKFYFQILQLRLKLFFNFLKLKIFVR